MKYIESIALLSFTCCLMLSFLIMNDISLSISIMITGALSCYFYKKGEQLSENTNNILNEQKQIREIKDRKDFLEGYFNGGWKGCQALVSFPKINNLSYELFVEIHNDQPVINRLDGGQLLYCITLSVPLGTDSPTEYKNLKIKTNEIYYCEFISDKWYIYASHCGPRYELLGESLQYLDSIPSAKAFVEQYKNSYQ